RLVPVDARPLQSQVHDTANRTLDRTTADRQLQLGDLSVVHPTLSTVPFEVFTLAPQRLAGTGTAHGLDRCLHLLDSSFPQATPLASDPRLTLRRRPAALQGRDLAQVLDRMIEVHQLMDLVRSDPQAPHQRPDPVPDPTRPISNEQDLVCRGNL